MKGVTWNDSRMQFISAEAAATMLAWSDPELQRPPSERHVDKLGTMMMDGDFLTGHIVIANLNGRKVLANGQHTLLAIHTTGKQQRCLVEEYTVEDMKAYARLFHAFDTEARVRTWLECARAYQMGRNGDMPNRVTPALLNAFRNGYEFFLNLNRSNDRAATRLGRFGALTTMKNELSLFAELSDVAIDHKLIKRAPVVAAVIGTSASDLDVATTFWREVVTGFFSDQGNAHAPAYRLHQFLRNTTIFSGGGGSERSRSTRRLGTSHGVSTQFDVYCCCINAWNAHCQGRTLKFLKASTSGKVPAISRPYAEVFMA